MDAREIMDKVRRLLGRVEAQDVIQRGLAVVRQVSDFARRLPTMVGQLRAAAEAAREIGDVELSELFSAIATTIEERAGDVLMTLSEKPETGR